MAVRFQKAASKADREAKRLDRRPVDVVLGVEGGGSKHGATSWRQWRTCPHAAALRQAGLVAVGAGSEALDLGLLFHAGLEAYYTAVQLWQGTVEHEKLLAMPAAELVPQRFEAECWEALRAFESEPGYEETWPIAERLLSAYFEAYRGLDRWLVLAVEETLAFESLGLEYSARLDLLVHDLESGGTWVIEHKTAKALTETLLSGYQLDLQTLGHVWLMRTCVDLDALEAPPLSGVVVNIVSKTKVPKAVRVSVCPSEPHLRMFERSARAQVAFRDAAAHAGYPRWLGNCSGAVQYFGRCEFFELCHNRPLDSVADMLEAKDPPFGYVWNERT